MTLPTIVLTDHLNGVAGELAIEVGHAAHFECVSASTIGAGEWIQAKIEWSINDTGSAYSTDMRGFNFSHYCQTVGTFTVTCRVTNVNGESTTVTRDVEVSASTRSTVNVSADADLKTVHDANSGSNKEFVLAGDVTCSGTIAPGSNVVFRSSVAGTPRRVSWAGTTGSFANYSGVDSVTWRDLAFARSGGTRSVSVMEFAGTNTNVIDCSVDAGVCSGQMLNCASNPVGVLIQDTHTIHDAGGQCIWMGNSVARRMAAVYGGSHVADENNEERAIRGAGWYIAIVDSYVEQQNVTNGKDAMSMNANAYYYLYRTEIRNSSATGTGYLFLIGHTSGTNIISNVVVDKCLLQFTSRIGTWPMGANTSSCDQVMVRNCVVRNVVISTGNVTNIRFHHNTTITPNGGARWLNVGAVASSSITMIGNLGVWGATAPAAILVTSVTDTATEFDLIANNVTGAVSGPDVDINDAINGNKDESWSTFNARGNASGNLRKTVTINAATYRPDTVEDTDLLISPHADMGIFPEDYYGNPRPAQFLIGAVDVVPPPTQWFLVTAGGQTYVIGA